MPRSQLTTTSRYRRAGWPPRPWESEPRLHRTRRACQQDTNHPPPGRHAADHSIRLARRTGTADGHTLHQRVEAVVVDRCSRVRRLALLRSIYCGAWREGAWRETTRGADSDSSWLVAVSHISKVLLDQSTTVLSQESAGGAPFVTGAALTRASTSNRTHQVREANRGYVIRLASAELNASRVPWGYPTWHVFTAPTTSGHFALTAPDASCGQRLQPGFHLS